MRGSSLRDSTFFSRDSFSIRSVLSAWLFRKRLAWCIIQQSNVGQVLQTKAWWIDQFFERGSSSFSISVFFLAFCRFSVLILLWTGKWFMRESVKPLDVFVFGTYTILFCPIARAWVHPDRTIMHEIKKFQFICSIYKQGPVFSVCVKIIISECERDTGGSFEMTLFHRHLTVINSDH